MSGEAFATIIGAGLTAGAALLAFFPQLKQANKRPFKQKQLELYFLASETVSALATEFDREKWERSRSTFWQLYWGPLSLVEDPKVESSMIEIGGIVPKSPESSSEVPIRSLERPSLHFAHLMRGLIEDDWKVGLKPLSKKKGPIQPETWPQSQGPGPKSPL